jgi:hypothetical protein
MLLDQREKLVARGRRVPQMLAPDGFCFIECVGVFAALALGIVFCKWITQFIPLGCWLDGLNITFTLNYDKRYFEKLSSLWLSSNVAKRFLFFMLSNIAKV